VQSGRFNLSSFNTLKTSKTILAGLLAFALVGAASAQTHLRITGSTAFRAATLQAIANILQPGFTLAYQASASEPWTKANIVIFTGTTTGGTSVVIKTAFFGSIGGVANVAGGLTVGVGGTAFNDGQTIGWLEDSTPQSTTDGTSGGTQIAPGNAVYDTPTAPDVTLSDSFQASAPTQYQKPVLTGEIVGVVPFEWIASPGKAALGTVTNLTSAHAKTLLEGTLKLKTLSHNKKDTESVFCVGRDEDSGTRIAALADTAYGIHKAVIQYQPLFDGATAPANPPPPPGTQITGAAKWPGPVTVDGISYPAADSGYNSGGSVASAIIVPHNSAYHPWFISYLGLNDAATALASPNCFALDFNGTAYSAATVEDGTYTFWGYEHFLYLPALTGLQRNVAQLIENNILDVTASVSGVLVADMTVHRNSDGGAIMSGGNPPNKP
jgi:hypothetical protein